MDVEVVHDKMPPGDRRIGGNYPLTMAQKIGFGAGRAAAWGNELATDHVPAEDERPSAMADILEFPALHLTWRQRQARVLAFQRLHAGQLIGADHPFALVSPVRRLSIQGTDVLDFGNEVGLQRRRQPISHPVRLQRPLFNSRAAWRPEICSTMPCCWISAAISRAVHWLMGRPARSGASQASAMIRQTCSSVIRAGVPGRGASVKRSATLSSSPATAWRANQRVRHRRTVSTATPSWRAIWLLLAPAAAVSTIRARNASCCEVLWHRLNWSKSWRSAAVNSMTGGLGPRIGSSSGICGWRPPPHLALNILRIYFSQAVLVPFPP